MLLNQRSFRASALSRCLHQYQRPWLCRVRMNPAASLCGETEIQPPLVPFQPADRRLPMNLRQRHLDDSHAGMPRAAQRRWTWTEKTILVKTHTTAGR